MTERDYRVLVAGTRDELLALAPPHWRVLENTIRPFQSLDTHDDQSFGEIGRVKVSSTGWVALAFKT